MSDDTQGVQSDTIKKLARYWGTDYDWRKGEAKLNAVPHFITEIDGLDIRFIHVKSKHENAMPIVITHGWPGSVIEQMKVIDPLTNPTAHGGSASDAFQTLYALADSPVGLAAWMIDHDIASYRLITRVFDGKAEGLTRDDILDNASLYWLTNTAVSSARLYWESKLAFFGSHPLQQG